MLTTASTPKLLALSKSLQDNIPFCCSQQLRNTSRNGLPFTCSELCQLTEELNLRSISSARGSCVLAFMSAISDNHFIGSSLLFSSILSVPLYTILRKIFLCCDSLADNSSDISEDLFPFIIYKQAYCSAS